MEVDQMMTLMVAMGMKPKSSGEVGLPDGCRCREWRRANVAPVMPLRRVAP